MPIYAYKCASCGHAKDVLQKMSDDPLTVCPHCGADAFSKQVTAAGFQLKGSGWYATDFKGGAKSGAEKSTESTTAGESGDPKPAEAKPVDSKPVESKPVEKATPKSDAPPAAGS